MLQRLSSHEQRKAFVGGVKRVPRLESFRFPCVIMYRYRGLIRFSKLQIKQTGFLRISSKERPMFLVMNSMVGRRLRSIFAEKICGFAQGWIKIEKCFKPYVSEYNPALAGR
jgi:hypothetical protein